MRRVLDVFLGETARQVGTLRFEAQGARQSAGFEYHPDWLAAEDRFALEPGLPLVSGMQFHQQARDGSLFHGAIADTEPMAGGARSSCATTPSNANARAKKVPQSDHAH